MPQISDIRDLTLALPSDFRDCYFSYGDLVIVPIHHITAASLVQCRPD